MPTSGQVLSALMNRCNRKIDNLILAIHGTVSTIRYHDLFILRTVLETEAGVAVMVICGRYLSSLVETDS